MTHLVYVDSNTPRIDGRKGEPTGMTVDRSYEVLYDDGHFITVTNDLGKKARYMKSRFSSVAIGDLGLPIATDDQYETPLRDVAYETQSGEYAVTKNNEVVFYNSGYKQNWSIAEFKKGLESGKLGEWEVSDRTIGTNDEVHWFDYDIISTLIQ